MEKALATPDQVFAARRARMQETIKLDPEVSIHLGTADFTLVYTNRAAKDVLTDCGLNLLTTPPSLQELGDPKVLGSLLHRGLQHRHPDLTATAVDDLITIRHTLYIQSQLMIALSLFYPDFSDIPLPEKGGADAGPAEPDANPT